MEDTTAINPSPSKVTQMTINSSPHLGVETTRVTALAKTWTATAMRKETQEPEALPTVRHTVVIPKQKRPRKVTTPKLLVTWRNVTIPCLFLDRLTPAILLEDIGNSPWDTPGSLLKAMLNPTNCPMGRLSLEIPLSLQGIGQGDTLTMLVRYAKVYHPHDVQHFVAYRAEDAMQYFLTTLLGTTTIPALTECVIFYEGLPLDPTSRFQDCNLPHDPTLHLRFHSGQDVPPIIRAENPKSAEDPRDGPMSPHAKKSLPTDNPEEPQNEP